MLLITEQPSRFVINPRIVSTFSFIFCIFFSSLSTSTLCNALWLHIDFRLGPFQIVAAAADGEKKAKRKELNEALLLFNLTAKSERGKKLFTLPSAVAVWITKKKIHRQMQLLYSNCRKKTPSVSESTAANELKKKPLAIVRSTDFIPFIAQ